MVCYSILLFTNLFICWFVAEPEHGNRTCRRILFPSTSLNDTPSDLEYDPQLPIIFDTVGMFDSWDAGIHELQVSSEAEENILSEPEFADLAADTDEESVHEADKEQDSSNDDDNQNEVDRVS